MSIQFNHTIVFARNREESAMFLADILGLEVGAPWGPFLPLQLDNGVTLDFATSDQETISIQHYAFLVSDSEFEPILERVTERGLTFWADPHRRYANTINRNDGGRGFYFLDPVGHGMEVITRPYGSLVG